jgi:predicted nucleic acid-binding protein
VNQAKPVAVLDASAAGRWLIDADPAAEAIVRRGHLTAPSLIAAEVANALRLQVRVGRLASDSAQSAMRDLLDAEIQLVPIEGLARAALAVALELGVSAYDASYIALAELLDLPLVTADRRLAAVYDRAELVG